MQPEERQDARPASLVGRQLIFEDTGQPLGTIKREIKSADGSTVISYEVDKAGNLMQFPAAAIKTTSEGIYFVPIWFVETQEFVRELEYQSTIMPEFVQLLSSNELDVDRLLSVVEQSDPKLRTLIEESAKLKETITKRLSSLELEKLRIKKESAMLQNAEIAGRTRDTERQRGELLAREKSADLNANRCREILQRLSKSPFVPKTPIKARVERIAHEASFPRARKFRVLEVEKQVEDMQGRLGGIESSLAYHIDARLQIFKNEIVSALALENARSRKDELAAELEELKALKSDAKTEPTFSSYIKKRIETLAAQDGKLSARIEELTTKSKDARASEPKVDLSGISSGKCKVCDAPIPTGATSCPSCGVAITSTSASASAPAIEQTSQSQAAVSETSDDKAKLVKKVKAPKAPEATN